MSNTTQPGADNALDLDKLEALALATTRNLHMSGFDFAMKITPSVVLSLIELARRATPAGREAPTDELQIAEILFGLPREPDTSDLEKAARLIAQRFAAPVEPVTPAPRVRDELFNILNETAARGFVSDDALSRLSAAIARQAQPTDLSKRLRNIASEDTSPYFCTNVPKDDLRAAADEIERKAQPTDRDAVLNEIESVIEQAIEDLLSENKHVSSAKFCLEAVRALKSGGSTTEGAA